MDGRSRMTINPRIPAMPGEVFTDQAGVARLVAPSFAKRREVVGESYGG